jgi:hypothetical protein
MQRAWGIAAVGLAVGLLLLSVGPALTSNVDDMDVLIYAAAAARANAEGALPYVAAWVEKGPLAMAWYQAMDALFGRYPLGAIAASVLLFHAVAAAGIFLGGRALAGVAAGAWGTALYLVAAGAAGGTLNTEVPAAAMLALAWWRWLRAETIPAAALAGVLAAAAALCRQNAGILWPAMLLGEGLRVLAGRSEMRPAVGRGLALTAGFTLPILAVLLVYAAAGALPILVFCVYGYNASIYVAATQVTAERLAAIPQDLWGHFFGVVPTASVLGLLGLALAPLGWKRGKPEALATAIAAAAATASLILGLRWFEHYFVLAIPLWSVLGGMAAAWLLDPRRGPASRRGLAAAGIVAVCGGLFWEVHGRTPRRGLGRLARLLRGPAVVSDPTTWPGRDPLTASVGRWMRAHARPQDRAFVWGMRPHVYVMSGLLPGTRFVIGTFLTGMVPWERVGSEEDTTRWIVPGSRELLMEDLRRDPPRFVVDASQDHLFGDGAYRLETFPELHELLRARYAPAFREGTTDRMVVWMERE